jgi:hypothetical protein
MSDKKSANKMKQLPRNFKEKSVESRSSFPVKFKIDCVEEYLKRLARNNKLSKAEFARTLSYKGDSVPVETFKKWVPQLDIFRKVENQDRQKLKCGEFDEIEVRLVEYLKFRKERFSKDKCGMTYELMRDKAFDIADVLKTEGQLSIQDREKFKASNGWIHNVLTRHNLIDVIAHGEKGDIDEADAALKMSAFKDERKIS